MEYFTVKRLRTKAVFKLIFTGLFCAFVPLFTLLGALASLNLVTMYWGQTQITGITALVLGPIYGVLFTIVFGFLISVFTSLGLIIYSKRAPIKLEFYEVENREDG